MAGLPKGVTVLYLFGMKKKTVMTTVEFAKASGVAWHNVVRWCQKGIIPGAILEEAARGPIWQIPASALDTLEKWRPARGRPLKREEELSRPRRPRSGKRDIGHQGKRKH